MAMASGISCWYGKWVCKSTLDKNAVCVGWVWKIIWVMSSEKMHKICRFRSSWACSKYHPGLCSSFIHSVVSNDSVSWQWMPWSACTDAQADLGLHSLHHCARIHVYECCSQKKPRTFTDSVYLPQPLQALVTTAAADDILNFSFFFFFNFSEKIKLDISCELST